MIIDSLTHVTENGEWFYKNHSAKIEELITSMDKNNIDKAVLVANPPLNDNEYISGIEGKYKSRFYKIGCLTKEDFLKDNIEGKVQSLKNDGFIGVKVHPRFCEIALSDAKIIAVLALCKKYNLICYICTLHRPPSQPIFRPLYDIIHEICTKSNGAKIVFVHGGYYELLQTSEIVRNYENVLLDLSLTLPRFAKTSIGKDIAFLFETFEKRIVVGTDFPEYNYDDIKKSLQEIGVRFEDFIGEGPFGENLLKLIESEC